MAIDGKLRLKFTGRTFFLCIGIWGILFLIVLMGIHFLERRQKQNLIKIGVAISKDISSQSGLTLLEKNFDLLSRRIEAIKEKPEVIFASIIDHKNKIIAYTDQDQFFSMNRKKSGEQDGVMYWRISDVNHNKVMNFSSEITFSGTRIGEVFISLAVNGIGPFRRWFFVLSALGLSGILICFGMARYQDCLVWWKAKHLSLSSSLETSIETNGNGDFHCPMCNGKTGFTQNICNTQELDNFVVLKDFSHDKKAVLLKELQTSDELEWLKKRMIARSAKIISEVSTE